MNAKKRRISTAKKCFGHLGGVLGNRVFERLIESGWFELEEGKATVYRITKKGHAGLDRLGVDLGGDKE